jgi:hypothetical protein
LVQIQLLVLYQRQLAVVMAGQEFWVVLLVEMVVQAAAEDTFPQIAQAAQEHQGKAMLEAQAGAAYLQAAAAVAEQVRLAQRHQVQ